MENVPKKILKLDPNTLCTVEIKGLEAFEEMKAALSGHPVLSTIHADYPESRKTLLQEELKNE